MADFDEIISLLEQIARVNAAVTLPVLQKKTGMTVVSAGTDFGQLQTNIDLGISGNLLNGGLGYAGFRQRHPGSFSEEDDDATVRLSATTVLQVDPMDGTGDFKKTYSTGAPIGPTTLVSKLVREDTSQPFRPVAGIIFDIIDGIALISDGSRLGLYCIKDGKVRDVKFELAEPQTRSDGLVAINRRYSYGQTTFDGPFMNFLYDRGIFVQQVAVGGAGTQAMHVLRNYVQPTGAGAEGFARRTPISILFNAQPDWKTWDTDPNEPFAEVLGLAGRTDIYGEALKANAANPTLKDMHHTAGYVLSTSSQLRDSLTAAAIEWRKLHPDKPLTEKNY
jgi:hypothetical protein